MALDIKAHVWKIITGVVVIVGVVTGIWKFDDRYVKHNDLAHASERLEEQTVKTFQEYDIVIPVGVVIIISMLGGFAVVLINYKKLCEKLNETVKELGDSKNNYNTLLHQKKSSEVRLGKIAENMAPFFDAWPYDPNNFRFLGNPVDGIQFTDEAVVFIEIKSGKARLTQGQKSIRDLVKEGKVQFATFRVGEEDCLLKMEEIEDVETDEEGS